MPELTNLLERDEPACASQAGSNIIVVKGKSSGLQCVSVADATAVRELAIGVHDHMQPRHQSEPYAIATLSDYQPAAKALKLTPVPVSMILDENAADFFTSANCLSAKDALGLEVLIRGDRGEVIGRIPTVEAAFWLDAGKGTIVPFMGGIEVALDCHDAKVGDLLVTPLGYFVGVIIAVSGNVAIATPAESFMRENELQFALSSDLREHNARAVAQQSEAEGTPLFGEVIRLFGARMTGNSAFYSRAVGA